MLEFDYLFLASWPQPDPCLRCLGTPVFASCYFMKYAQEAAAWDLLHPRKVFWALSYASSSCWWHFCLIKGRRCRKTRWIHRPDERICRHNTREAFAVPLVGNRPEIEEVTHTLIPVGTNMFSGPPYRSFREITSPQGHSFTHLVLRCRYPPILSVLPC